MKFLILGCGYTGQILQRHLAERGQARIVVTTRTERDVSVGDLEAGVMATTFDLGRKDSWQNILASPYAPDRGRDGYLDRDPRTAYDTVFWLFPAQPSPELHEFVNFLKPLTKKVVVVGSTSGFKVARPGEKIHEESRLDLAQGRVVAEEFLRSQGAVIIRAAGIYGVGRDPRRWLESGVIKAGGSWLNLIHGEDLARMLVAAVEAAAAGTQWIASDQNPLRWTEIVDRLGLSAPSTFCRELEKADSKWIDSSRSWRESQILPRYLNLFEGIGSICEP